MVMRWSLINKLKSFPWIWHKSRQSLHPTLRIVEIEKDPQDNYLAVVQFVGKNKIFRMKPEEILANDDMTDLFSQRDIRTLTYLGYLGIHSPQYKILAKHLSERDNQLTFTIQKKGEIQPVEKTASEITLDKALLQGFTQEDAHMLGFASALEQANNEKIQKQHLLRSVGEKNA